MKIYPLDVALFVAGLPFDGNTIPSGQSLGGSETAGIQLAEEMARQGHRPTIFCNCTEPMDKNGVQYTPIGWHGPQGGFPKGFYDFGRSMPVDLMIVQRIPSMYQFEFKSKVNFLWQHDLATRTGPSQFHPFLWNIDKIIVLSQFMKKQYQSLHGGIDSMYHVSRNGIDPGLFDQTGIARDRFKIMFTARPERGMDILLRGVMPRILSREPRAKLYVARYQDPNPSMQVFYGACEQQAKQLGDRVEFLGNLGKTALYEHYKSARLYLYPSMFEEVDCITAREVAACGCVFLGPWRAALPETIGGAAPLLKDDGSMGQPGDEPETGLKPPVETFVDAMAEHALQLMHDDEYWTGWQRKSLAKASNMSWESVAHDWINLAHEIIAEKTDDPKRVFRHFIFNSDVVAAQKYVAKVDVPVLKEAANKYIDRFIPFMSTRIPNPPTIAQFYEERSGGANANWQTAFYAEQEIRLHALKQFLRDKVASGEIKTLLDFGCAHGGYTKSLTDEFPTLQVIGVDNSPSLIRCANELKANGQCKHPENMSFLVADEDKCNRITEEMPGHSGFDCVVAMEVLEHLPHAEDAAAKLEKLCKPGGWCVFTVPFGHRERDEFVTKGVPPVHVRQLDLHDLRDIFGKKPNYGVASFSDLQEHALDRTFSCWFMTSFRADHKPLGEIDWERKFFLQAPRQTMAVCVIANNTEDVMHQCLRSVVKLADQIIVVDNGPSKDRTAEVAAEYTDDVRSGTSPFWCYKHMMIHAPDQINPAECEMAGFETPRNESTEGVWADWIMWIDCDEQLLDPGGLMKYLRQNCYLGYAMQQHHVSIDTGPVGIKKDIPVRLYRNIPGMRFYGLVHEHAELGINRGIGAMVTVISDVQIYHGGYLNETIRRGRFRRNIKLLECDRKKYPERILGAFLWEIRDSIHQARYAMEQNGGVVTDEVRAFCERAIAEYRKRFLVQQYALVDDSLSYYSQALAILGQGVEVAVDLDVKKQGAALNGSHTSLRFRAADGPEINTIVGAKIGALAAQYEGRYLQ